MYKSKRSIYECPVDKSHTIKEDSGKKVICRICGVEMKEVTKEYRTK